MDDATWEKMKEQWWLGATTKKRMEASLRAKGFVAFFKIRCRIRVIDAGNAGSVGC